MKLEIRGLAAEDLDRVAMLAGGDAQAPQWTRRDYEQILLATPGSAPARRALVGLSDGTLAGLAVASWLRQEAAAELEALVVDHDYRRQGIGAALVLACMAWAATDGASALRLEVRASNQAALRLYRRLGFSATGTRRAYYSAPAEDALLLEAPLLPL